jgi:hypothetical protein
MSNHFRSRRRVKKRIDGDNFNDVVQKYRKTVYILRWPEKSPMRKKTIINTVKER